MNKDIEEFDEFIKLIKAALRKRMEREGIKLPYKKPVTELDKKILVLFKSEDFTKFDEEVEETVAPTVNTEEVEEPYEVKDIIFNTHNILNRLDTEDPKETEILEKIIGPEIGAVYLYNDIVENSLYEPRFSDFKVHINLTSNIWIVCMVNPYYEPIIFFCRQISSELVYGNEELLS